MRLGIRFRAVIFVLLAIGAARFLYSVTRSPHGWTGETYMQVAYARTISPVEEQYSNRRWGPLFIPVMEVFGRAAPLIPPPLLIRIVLAGLYAAILWMLIRWDKPAAGAPFTVRDAVIVFVALQSTAAIYALANGNGEFITAACIVGNFYYFVRKQYALAALLICAGVWFKLLPLVFLFPYFLFALISPAHRRYVWWVTGAGLAIALLSVPFAGWTFGFLYPAAMLRSVSSNQHNVILLFSREVFGPVFFAGRMLTSFHVREPDAVMIELTKSLTRAASILLFAGTAAAALILRRLEPSWSASPEKRNFALLVFETAIGLLYFTFAVDFSIAHLLLISVALYAPLWLVLDDDCRPKLTPGRTWTAVALYGAGTLAIGNLLPLSVLGRILPFHLFDRMTGNTAADLIPIEKYIWYQIPMVAVLLIAAAFFTGAVRRRETSVINLSAQAEGEAA